MHMYGRMYACHICTCISQLKITVSQTETAQALTVNALSGDDRELWMRAIADKVQQLKDALVVLPKRKGTR